MGSIPPWCEKLVVFSILAEKESGHASLLPHSQLDNTSRQHRQVRVGDTTSSQNAGVLHCSLISLESTVNAIRVDAVKWLHIRILQESSIGKIKSALLLDISHSLPSAHLYPGTRAALGEL